jgi:DNA glycosylase AlkZ-like
MDKISIEQAILLRARAQHLLVRAPRSGIVDVVRALCGVNAQLKPAMLLSLRARIKGFEPSDVADGVFTRTWAMRGTVHLLASEDLRCVVSLLGPTMITKGKRRRAELGLDDETLAQCLKVIRDILDHDGPLTRGGLMDRLAGRGVNIAGTGQAPYHLIAYAGLRGLICMGPDKPDGDPTYILVDHIVKKQKPESRDETLVGLVCRYLGGYGPASPRDFASWSGLSMADAKDGWTLAMKKGPLKEVVVGDRVLWCLESRLSSMDGLVPADPVVDLLPAFDSLILGYSERDLLVPKKYQKEVYHGGQTVPVVLVNGSAAGVWRYERRGKTLNVRLRPFVAFDGTVKAGIEDEVDDIGRLFGLSASLTYA